MHLEKDFFVVQDQSELPYLKDKFELFLDVETERVFDHKDYGGMYPWKGDKIAGVAVTCDDDPRAWYVPVRHRAISAYKNLELEIFQPWLEETLSNADGVWINHNILFDIAFTNIGEQVENRRKLVDTLTLAKTHDSDRMSQGLKELCADYFDEQNLDVNDIANYLKLIKSKSYADVPPDIMAIYACKDVRERNRRLYRYLVDTRPEQLKGIWNSEILLTPVLHDMERIGLQLNRKEVQLDKLKGLHKLIGLSTDISESVGREFTSSNQCMYDILVNVLNLPVLATKFEKNEETGEIEDTGRATFDKKAMALYKIHPAVKSNTETARIIGLLHDYSKEAQHQNLFVEPFLELMDEFECIHSSYNQVVRTGRMSCRRPNAQQQNKRSKALIKPHKGYGFLSLDYSQIEFRLIVHFIKDQDAIKAYNDNPDTDFHQWVADMIGVKRKPAKTLNFGMGYGAGKKKVESELAANEDIIADVSDQVVFLVKSGKVGIADTSKVFHELCKERASQVYQTYHEKLPGVKATSYDCANVCRYRGYVFNPAGRRRHLPADKVHKAFNSLVQGFAMDLIKDRMIQISPRYNERIRNWGIRLVANVHDEVLFEVPLELLHNQEVHQYIITVLETPGWTLRVPIRVGLGVSASNWAQASGDDLYVDAAGHKVAGKFIGPPDHTYVVDDAGRVITPITA